MNFNFWPEDEAVRAEVRAWVQPEVRRDPGGKATGMRIGTETQFARERKLAAKGGPAWSWPAQFGGRAFAQRNAISSTPSERWSGHGL